MTRSQYRENGMPPKILCDSDGFRIYLDIPFASIPPKPKDFVILTNENDEELFFFIVLKVRRAWVGARPKLSIFPNTMALEASTIFPAAPQ